MRARRNFDERGAWFAPGAGGIDRPAVCGSSALGGTGRERLRC